jgi:outer membrane protein insertion porin family
MNRLLRHGGLWLLLLFVCVPTARAQLAADRISQIVITNVGREVATPALVRANIRAKVGDVYNRQVVNQDIPNLYATHLFANVLIRDDQTPGGVILTYVLEGRQRISSITVDGNTKFSSSKLLKKASSHVGDPLDELNLLNDSRQMEEMYEKSGYTGTSVHYQLVNVDQTLGQAGVLFQVTEKPKVYIKNVEFIGATAFPQSKLRKVIQTRRHWWFSFLTGHGVFKQDDFDDDPDLLANFYRNDGYVDFQITGTNITYPSPHWMIVQLTVSEGRQYHVGSVTFEGNSNFPTAQISAFLKGRHKAEKSKAIIGTNGLEADAGLVFRPDSLEHDLQSVEDFYGSKGYIDVIHNGPNLYVEQIPDTDAGTIDLKYHIKEGQKFTIEKIEIKGNVTTRDKVIRRELSVSPGDTFDMLQVKLSQRRLQRLEYFTADNGVKVDTESDPTLESEGKRDLVITVDEQSTGKMSFGAGYDSITALSGFVEVEERNFDLFKPPYFIGKGGGEKVRLYIQVGELLQNYELDFQEPWFLGHKLVLDTSLYRNVSDYSSLNNLYDTARTGFRVGLTRALGSDYLLGSVSYTLEQVDIFNVNLNAPNAILDDSGARLLNRFGVGLAWDSRNDVELPNGGTLSKISSQLTVGDRSYLKTEISSAWYFKGFAPGHVIELVGRAGVAQKIGNDDVPFYDRYYLGGLRDLRGFDYTAVGPREVSQDGSFYEPIGGDTYWMGSLEYSLPVMGPVRLAAFYDIGNVSAKPWNNAGFPVSGLQNEGILNLPPGFRQLTGFDAGNTGTFSDNYGIGIHINIPNLGPLRLDYGIPIHHDPFSSSTGKFQFGVGFTRPL